MLHCVVEFCAAVLCVVDVFLHDVQCCYMLPRVIACCAVLLPIVMLPRVITCCAVLLNVTKSYYMLCNVCYSHLELHVAVLLHDAMW